MSVVRYRPVLHNRAHDELLDLPREQRTRIRETIQAVAETREPTNHEKAKHLTGQVGKFRVRAGEIRAVCSLDKPRLIVWKVGHRDSVYENIGKTLADRA